MAIALWLVAGALEAFRNLMAGFPLSGTAAKLSFLNFGLFLVPVSAAIGFYAAGRAGASRVRAGVLTGFGTLLGLLAGALAARAWFPDYPRVGPHEVIAVSFAFAGPAGATLVLARRGVRSPAVRLTGVVALWAATAALIAVAVPGQSPAIDTELPRRLTSITRGQHSDWQDFDNFYVSAEITPGEFAAYTAALQMVQTERPFDCELGAWSVVPRLRSPTPSETATTWLKDETVKTTNLERYPGGYYGCRTQAIHMRGTVFACKECSWGI